MSSDYSENKAPQIRRKLISVHQSLEKKKRSGVIIGSITLLLVWVTTFLIIESQFYLSPEWKITGLISLIVICAGSLWYGFRNSTSDSFIEFYRSFARSSNLPQLSYALDLESAGNANPKLIEAAIFKNLEEVDPAELDRSLNHFLQQSDENRQASRRMLLLTGVVIITGLTAFSYSQSAQRLANFWQEYQKPNPFSFTAIPGDTTLEQGSAFTASLQFKGESPEEVFLMLKTPVEQEYRRRGMEATSGLFTSAPIDLNTRLDYYFEMDGYDSEHFEAKVQLRPRFANLDVAIVAPKYTQLDTTYYSYPFSQISGYQGSEVLITGKSNKKLEDFLLENSFAQEDVYLDTTLGFSYSFELEKADTIRFSLTDREGLKNQNPFRFTVQALEDEYPYVELLEPSESFEAVEPTVIDLLYRPTDDFSLTSASLHYELHKAFVKEPSKGTVPLSIPEESVLQNYTWDLSTLNLKPKDELTFWVEVTDNDQYNGYKTSRSQSITLTVPSLIEFFDNLGEQEDDVETDMEDISQSFEEMEQQYDNFKEQLKEDPQTNYEQKRQLEEVQKQQEEIEKRVEELNKKFEEIKDELSEKNLLSEETMEAYQELQELMEQIDDPAFREALKKLQENMNQMSPDQLRQAMEDVEFNEELYKQRLERTLELFKQLKLNSDLEKLAQSYEDLARQEEELENESGTSEEQQEQRESTLEQTEQLKKQIEELSENATEKTEKPVQEYQQQSQEELDRIQERLEEMLDKLREQAGENKENSESGEPSEAGEEQGKENDGEQQQGENQQQQQQEQQNQQPSLKQDFQQMAQMTRQMMEQMNQQQMQINIAGLQYILYSLLNLSIEQEDLVNYATTTENRSQAYVEYARDQKNVEDIFKTLSDSLYQLSTEIPQFSNQINEKKQEVERRIGNSLEEMAERNQRRSSVATRQALGGINEVSFMIANLLEQLQNSSSGGGGGGMSMQQMMQQMQQMGENQQQLNQQIQQMINDMQGDRLNQDQMERLNQISKQQNRIRQQLQEMQQNGSIGQGDRIGSELERMIEDMEDTINDLRGGAVDPTLIERQQNILSRMLNAEQSMQERDEEEKREGTTADDFVSPTPPDLTLEELEQQIRNRLNDPNFTKYSADYQRLIEKYFELLKEIQKREIQ